MTDLRCPGARGALLGRTDGGTGTVQLACNQCAAEIRRNSGMRFRVLHTFQLDGTCVHTEREPLND